MSEQREGLERRLPRRHHQVHRRTTASTSPRWSAASPCSSTPACDGIIVCGSLGEASTLEPDEKIEVLKTALRVAKGRVPVLLTVVEGSTRRAQALAERGAKAGADGFMVLPGVPYKSDARETMAHYRAVAKAGGLPVMIYNNPVSYGVDITPAMLGELAADPLFVAIKESSDDVRRVTQIFNAVGDRFQVFTGVDNLALESLAVGAHGWVAGLVCAFPAETVAIYRADAAGPPGRGARDLPLVPAAARPRRLQPARPEHQAGRGARRPAPTTAAAPRACRSSARSAPVVEAIVAKALANRPRLPALNWPRSRTAPSPRPTSLRLALSAPGEARVQGPSPRKTERHENRRHRRRPRRPRQRACLADEGHRGHGGRPRGTGRRARRAAMPAGWRIPTSTPSRRPRCCGRCRSSCWIRSGRSRIRPSYLLTVLPWLARLVWARARRTSNARSRRW